MTIKWKCPDKEDRAFVDVAMRDTGNDTWTVGSLGAVGQSGEQTFAAYDPETIGIEIEARLLCQHGRIRALRAPKDHVDAHELDVAWIPI